MIQGRQKDKLSKTYHSATGWIAIMIEQSFAVRETRYSLIYRKIQNICKNIILWWIGSKYITYFVYFITRFINFNTILYRHLLNNTNDYPIMYLLHSILQWIFFETLRFVQPTIGVIIWSVYLPFFSERQK